MQKPSSGREKPAPHPQAAPRDNATILVLIQLFERMVAGIFLYLYHAPKRLLRWIVSSQLKNLAYLALLVSVWLTILLAPLQFLNGALYRALWIFLCLSGSFWGVANIKRRTAPKLRRPAPERPAPCDPLLLPGPQEAAPDQLTPPLP